MEEWRYSHIIMSSFYGGVASFMPRPLCTRWKSPCYQSWWIERSSPVRNQTPVIQGTYYTSGIGQGITIDCRTTPGVISWFNYATATNCYNLGLTLSFLISRTLLKLQSMKSFDLEICWFSCPLLEGKQFSHCILLLQLNSGPKRWR